MKTVKQPQNAAKNRRNMPVKPYNMAVIDNDSAEINMYGDVVSVVPRDWWTDERLPGYIGVDEFLEDLEAVKDKANLTIHINSNGGDLYAGLAIYNRLKTFRGKLTTINDGLAASAASLIFQAGDVRQMNAGSSLMAHGVSGFLYGYYNIDDLKTMVTEFKAHNKAIVNVYAEAMGVSYDEAKGFVEGETWLVGQEAVDKGLADEVLESSDGDGVEDSLLNKLIAKAREAYKAQYPSAAAAAAVMANTAIPAAVPPIANKSPEESIETGGNDEMDIKNVNDLRTAFPEFVAQIENAARENAQTAGAQAERARIRAIEEIENSIADKALVNDAKYGENPMTAEQLALKAMQAQAKIGANMLNNMETDAAASGAEEVAAAPNGGTEETPEDDVENAAKEVAKLFNTMNGGRK